MQRVGSAPADNGIAYREGIGEYLNYYNDEHPHSSLADKTPDEIYDPLRITQRVS